jgi:hypothetical protein
MKHHPGARRRLEVRLRPRDASLPVRSSLPDLCASVLKLLRPLARGSSLQRYPAARGEASPTEWSSSLAAGGLRPSPLGSSAHGRCPAPDSRRVGQGEAPHNHTSREWRPRPARLVVEASGSWSRRSSVQRYSLCPKINAYLTFREVNKL